MVTTVPYFKNFKKNFYIKHSTNPQGYKNNSNLNYFNNHWQRNSNSRKNKKCQKNEKSQKEKKKKLSHINITTI